MNFDTPIYELKASKYRTYIPISLSQKLIEEKINLFNKSPLSLESPISGSKIIDIRKVISFYEGKKIYGIIIDTLNIHNIIKDLGLKETEEFIIKIKNKEGKNDTKCILSNMDVPYKFYYNAILNKII